MTGRIWSVAALFLVTSVHVYAANPAVRERTDFDPASGPWTALMQAGSRLELRGISGSIEVTPAESEKVSVTIGSEGGTELPRIEVVAHDQGYTICTMYVSPNPRKPNECVPGKDGRLTQGVKPNTPPVHFKIALPANVHLTGHIQRGSISAVTGPGESDFNLRTLAGDLSITDHGARHIRAEVFAGKLDAVIAPSEYERTVQLTNQNGPLRVAIPDVPVRYHLSPANRVRTNLELAAPVASMISGSFEGKTGKLLRLHLDAGVLLGHIELRRSGK